MLAAFPAWAHYPQCGPRDKVIEYITGEKWKQQLFAVGTADRDRIVEFYRNPDTGMWSIIITDKKITSCFVGAGKNYQEREIFPGDPA